MRTFITSLLVLFLCDILAYPGIITTVAGCDDIGPFKAPTAVTVDRQGNLYIADQEAYRIYKVDAVSGERRSIVGTGISGCPHNGNIATKSELSAPVSLAIDSAGSLYISDQSCEMVYKVDGESGIITELAGNGRCWTYQDQAPHRLGIALCEPSGITLDHKGNLYIADRGNSIIRKVNLRTSQATIEAGIHRIWGFSGDSGLATEAELHEPEAVAVDSLGNLYIADSWNYRIRKVDYATGIISTVLGGEGVPEEKKVGYVTTMLFDSAENLYYNKNYQAWRWNIAADTFVRIAGNGTNDFSGDGGPATEAGLGGWWYPLNFALDGSNNLYIADGTHRRVRMVSGDSNIITTLAAEEYPARVDGHLAVRSILNYTSGVAVDRSGNFFFIEVDNHKVRMVDRKSGIVTTVAGNGEAGFSGDGGLATEAMLNSPNGIALDSAGHLYIADGYNNRIRKVDVATGIISTIAGEGSKGFSGDGGLATEAMLNSPYGVAVDDSNNLYITDKNNLRIRKIDRDGIITTVAGNGERGFSGDGGLATEAMLDFPYGIAVDQSGYLYFVDRYNNRIRKVDLSTGIITTAAGNGTQGFSEDGTLATEAQLTSPQNIAVDRLGNLFISDLFYHRVRRVDQKSGLITTVAGSGQRGFAGDSSLAIEAELNSPVGIAVDRFDNLYIADAGNHRIRMVELDPALSIFTHQHQFYAEMRYDSESASLLLRSTKRGQLIVTDLLGNLLLTKAIEAGESRFDLSHLPRGRYFAQCGGAVGVITKGR